MPDVSSTATSTNEKAKLSELEKLAAKEAKNAERAAKKAEVRQAKVAKGTQKKAEGWEKKGRDSNGQKVYDFNANKANGSFVEFDDKTFNSKNKKHGVFREKIVRDLASGDAARSREWLGGIKKKVEFTERDGDKDVRTRKEKKNFAASKNVDYNKDGSKTIQRGSRNGIFSITYTNNRDGSRSFNGFNVGPFSLHRSSLANGAKKFSIGLGKTLTFSKSTDADGNKTQSYKLGKLFSNSKTVDKQGNITGSEKSYFGSRTKTFEKTKDGATKYTTKGRTVSQMKRDGLSEREIKDEIGQDIADGKVYRLKRQVPDGKGGLVTTQEYNRQTFKGKTYQYDAGDDTTASRTDKSSGWGFSKSSVQKLSAGQAEIAKMDREIAALKIPGAFPNEIKKINPNSAPSFASSKDSFKTANDGANSNSKPPQDKLLARVEERSRARDAQSVSI